MKTGQSETTADTNKSRVESLVIGANGLQLKTKMLETFNSPSSLSLNKQGSIEETPQKLQVNKKAIYRNSIEGVATKLEPIMENANNHQQDESKAYKQEAVR